MSWRKAPDFIPVPFFIMCLTENPEFTWDIYAESVVEQ